MNALCCCVAVCVSDARWDRLLLVAAARSALSVHRWLAVSLQPDLTQYFGPQDIIYSKPVREHHTQHNESRPANRHWKANEERGTENAGRLGDMDSHRIELNLH